MRNGRRHRHGVLLSLAMLAFGAGCGPAPGIDLTAHFADASIWVETEEIDLGTRPARQNLVSGWGDRDERWAGREEETFVWGLGAASEFDFYVVRLDSRAMTVIGRPYAPNGEAVIGSLRIFVNGVPLPEVAVRAGWERYQVPIPTRILRRGPNRVRIEYPPADADLRFAVDRVLFTNASVTALPRLGPAGTDSIRMPYLSGIEFDLEAEPGAELIIDRIRSYGRPTGEPPTLRVRIDAASEQVAHDTLAPGSTFTVPEPIPLGGLGTGPVRITLMVIPPEEFYGLEGHLAEQDTGIEIIAPRLTGPVRIQGR